LSNKKIYILLLKILKTKKIKKNLAIAFCCILAIQLTAQVNKVISRAGTTTIEEVTFCQNPNLQGSTENQCLR
jgi:UDP-N-acetylglucosamine:LPS N-acetylglucosamine transferase